MSGHKPVWFRFKGSFQINSGQATINSDLALSQISCTRSGGKADRLMLPFVLQATECTFSLP